MSQEEDMRQKTFALLLVFSAASISASALGNPLDESNACIAALQGDPKIQILSSKFPYDIFSSPTLEILANKSKPTPKEKVALSYLNIEREKCIDIGNEFRRNNFPVDIQALATTFRSDSVSTLADLYAGKMTYGEAAKVRAKIAADFRMNLDSLVQKYQAQEEIRQRQNQEAEDLKRSEERQAKQIEDNAVQMQSSNKGFWTCSNGNFRPNKRLTLKQLNKHRLTSSSIWVCSC
jgi:hypothetical protein